MSHRKWLVALIVTVALGTALYYTRRQPVTYVSTASVLIRPISRFTSGSSPATLPDLDTESLIALSDQVANIAAAKVGVFDARYMSTGLNVSVEPGSEIISFSYNHTNPFIAQERAQAFADAYLEFRRDEMSRHLESISRPTEARISALTERITRAQLRLNNSPAGPERFALQAELNSQLDQLGILQAQVAGFTAQATADVGHRVKPAQLPMTSSSPSFPKNLALALLGGIILAVASALARDRFDTRVRDRDILERHSGTTVLAEIPKFAAWRRRIRIPFVSTSLPPSTASKTYRSLCTSILDAASRDGMRLVLITSAQRGEGKTCITANAGLMLAEVGKRVILVDGDLRSPRLHDRVVDDTKEARAPDTVAGGLNSVLAGSMRPSEALVPTAVRNLHLLPTGPRLNDPAELLSSDDAARKVKELSGRADLILIDSAPILTAAEAMMMAALVDGVLLVVDAERTTTSQVDEACAQLRQVAAPLLGAVLNRADATGPSTRRETGSFAEFFAEHLWQRMPRKAGS